jgi:hypothetical protein
MSLICLSDCKMCIYHFFRRRELSKRNIKAISNGKDSGVTSSCMVCLKIRRHFYFQLFRLHNTFNYIGSTVPSIRLVCDDSSPCAASVFNDRNFFFFCAKEFVQKEIRRFQSSRSSDSLFRSKLL